MYPIYIPSKNRAKTCVTADLLQRESVPFLVVVEPQDYKDYKLLYGDAVIVLPKDNQGLAYSRSWIKTHSKQAGDIFHWQLDDDIKRFMIRENGKNIISTTIHALSTIEEFISQYKNIGAAGPTYTTFAFSRKTQYGVNKQVCSCFISLNSINAWWRDDTIDDTDYSMQILSSQYWCTLLFYRILIDVLPVGNNPGGLDTIYNSDKFVKKQQRLTEYWPGAFKLAYKKNGKTRIAPSSIWRKFPQKPIAIDT